MKWFRSIALILSIICLLSIVGCKRQSDPTIESSDVSSVTAEIESLISSEEVVPSESQEPVSSELSTVSEPEQVTSSQPEPSSITETPSSQAESSEPELPAIPFTVGYQERFLGVPVGSNFQNRFEAIIIRSEEELNQKFNIEAMSGEKKAFFEQCDAAYFEENAVLWIQLLHGSWSERTVTVDPVTRSGDQLFVRMYYDVPEGTVFDEATVMSTEDIFISIKQADVEGITEVIGQRSSQAE